MDSSENVTDKGGGPWKKDRETGPSYGRAVPPERTGRKTGKVDFSYGRVERHRSGAHSRRSGPERKVDTSDFTKDSGLRTMQYSCLST